MKDVFTLVIGGPAGAGILNTGLQLFAKTCVRNGLNVFTCSEYPSLIRGGHNYLTVTVGDKVYSHHKEINLLIALDKRSVDEHLENVKGGVIYDSSSFTAELPEDILAFPIPLKKIAEISGSALYRNTVAIGASFGLLGLPLTEMEKIIKERFAKKGEKVIEGNIQAAREGWNFVKTKPFPFSLETGDKQQAFLNGNEAVVLGAIRAGCKFISAYPMTPATSILTGMAKYSRKKGIVVKHTEDEIASINMAIGAGFAGVRAMTCTSGGGFALMAEGLGLAAQTETPIVIVESQRPGPGTGMATRTSQGDLNFMLAASTDEFPRVVIAPGDVNECYTLTQLGFNLAEKYQTPVVLLLDKFLSTSCQGVTDLQNLKIERGEFATDGDRYIITKSGVSPRILPGSSPFVASSYEHNSEGKEEESSVNRVAMHDKRYRKFETMAKELEEPKLHGEGEFVIVSWGSTKGVVREAKELGELDVAHLHLSVLSPFPKEVFSSLSDKRLIVVENNKTSQLTGLIAKEIGRKVDHKILKYDGRQFNPEDLSQAISEIMATSKEEIILSD